MGVSKSDTSCLLSDNKAPATKLAIEVTVPAEFVRIFGTSLLLLVGLAEMNCKTVISGFALKIVVRGGCGTLDRAWNIVLSLSRPLVEGRLGREPEKTDGLK